VRVPCVEDKQHGEAHAACDVTKASRNIVHEHKVDQIGVPGDDRADGFDFVAGER
jgi:hypothetical protein